MNILAIGYYDDFARFFLRLRKEIQNLDKHARFYYFSIYFSGVFYSFFKRVISGWFPFFVWFNYLAKRGYYNKIATEDSSYKGVDLIWLTEYHVKLDAANKQYYMAIGCAYLDYASSFIKRKKIDMILASGDSRMPVRAIIGIARLNNIAIRYFEQGAFGTTFFEHQGVNGNSAFKQPVSGSFVSDSDTTNGEFHFFIARKRADKFRRIPVYRAFDFLLNFFIGFSPVGREIFEKKSLPISKSSVVTGPQPTKRKYVVFAAQVPVDVNMVLHSPNFATHTEILTYLNQHIPADFNIVVREHPLFSGKYEQAFYQFINASDRITVDNSTSLPGVISNSELVVVNNSTVGIEALCYGKRVLVTGESYYENIPGVWKVGSDDDRLRTPDAYPLTERELAGIHHYLKVLLCDYLYPGHYRDDDLSFVTEIANDIILGKVRSEKIMLGG
ncbi:hypothetical protein [Pantoea sp. B65]|uniref:capsular polysaccharide export protein, LipB/KpsS family n=1 Tax=Pantoea sp. B65 TaxID=2813359 RepID=UPI0039B651C5